MECPYCNNKTKIIATEENNQSNYKIRLCVNCSRKYNTVEKILLKDITVVKRDNRREAFNEKKIKQSLKIATSKRPIPIMSIEAIIDDIIKSINNSDNTEISTKIISQMVISHLSRLDLISYVRYASTYQDFISLDHMTQELNKLSISSSHNYRQQELFSEKFL